MYSLVETVELVEGYEELQNSKHKLWILVRLLDLEAAMKQLPIQYKVYVYLIGLAGYTRRDAGDMLGVSHQTAARKYITGLLLLHRRLNANGYRD